MSQNPNNAIDETNITVDSGIKLQHQDDNPLIMFLLIHLTLVTGISLGYA